MSIRPQLVVALLMLLAVTQSLPGALGQTHSTPPPHPAEIRTLEVAEASGSLRVEISATAALNPPARSTLSNPSRLVFDFPGAVPRLPANRIPIDRHHIVDIRSSLFRTDKSGAPVTRLVFDLDQPVEFQSAVQSGKFIVTIHDRSQISAQKTPVPATRPVKQSPLQTPAPAKTNSAASTASNELNRIRVASTGDSLLIRLDFDKPAVPQTMHLDHPGRLVLDFPATSFSPLWSQPSTLPVNAGAVKAVRAALFKRNPPVLRVVFDQDGVASPKISSEGSSLILRFPGGNSISAGAKPPAAKPPVALDHERRLAPKPESDSLPTAIASLPSSLPGISPKPPVVKYQSGWLSLDADNSTLADVLRGISKQTGVSIDIPNTEGMRDLIVLKIGPARPVSVISTLLQASSFKYHFSFSSDGKLTKVTLAPK